MTPAESDKTAGEHEHCIVCAHEIDMKTRFNTIGKCDHGGRCSLCTLRMRQLMDDKSCVVCRIDLDQVICTESMDASFEDFTIWGDSIGPGHVYDETSSMFFVASNYPAIQDMRKMKCAKCNMTFPTMKALKSHVLKHKLTYCSICIQHKHSFIQEHVLYTQAELRKHQMVGTPEEGFRGHPKCDFCDKRFYSNLELYHHLNRQHYECDICDKEHGIQYRYYKDYDSLQGHFRDDHYLCEEPSCLAKKFVVFKTLVAYKSHMATLHPEIKQSNRLEVNFTIRRANRDGSGVGFTQLDVTPEEAQVLIEEHNRGRQPVENADQGEPVEDFPALGEVGIEAMNLWSNQSIRTPKEEDFPALPASEAPVAHHNHFRNALRPPPTPAMAAYASNDSWAYPTTSAKPQDPMEIFGKSKRIKKKKFKQKNSPDRSLAARLGTGNAKTEVQPNKPVIEQIRECVLGGEQAFMIFTEACKAFRMDGLPAQAFYDRVKPLFQLEDFNRLFPHLISSLPDKNQRTEVLQIHHDNDQKPPAIEEHTQEDEKAEWKEPKKTVKPELSAAERRKLAQRRQQQRKAQTSGLASALAQTGYQPTSTHGGFKVGNKGSSAFKKPNRKDANTVGWSSSRSIGDRYQKSPAEEVEEKPAVKPVHTAPRVMETTSTYPSRRQFMEAAPKQGNSVPLRNKGDFPSLPKAGPAVGRQVVTKDNWDEEAKKLAAAPNGESGKSKKQKNKKKKMGLGEFAMNFK